MIWGTACRFAVGMLAVSLCSTSLCSKPTAAAEPEDGRRAYDAGRFTDAMGIWSELSQQGNAEAEFGLGLLYDLGNGIKENPVIAFGFYKLAADTGLPAAEFNVGAMYDSGRGVAQSSQDAALWYAKAAAQGHHRAQFDIALMYQQGEGLPRNSAAAAAWFKEAAAGGLTAASSRLKALGSSPTDQPASHELTAVTLATPSRGAAITLKAEHPTVELVWVAPPQPQPVHYVVQVRALDGENLTTVFTASLTTTAAVVPLPEKADFYVWNVDTVGQDGSHNAGDWSWFSMDTTGASGQSVASMPQNSIPVH